MSRKYIDLSHTISGGEITYKGLLAPIICDYLSREESKEYYQDGTSFQIGKIEMVSNTGTYRDCPFLRYDDGKDLSQVNWAFRHT
ncbi:MAG: arylformamidase [Saprospiraceae bacterium]|jgi:arylformamidase